MNLIELASKTKEASNQINKASTNDKNLILNNIIEALLINQNEIFQANTIDLKIAKANGMNDGLLDRMLLNKSRLEGIIEGIKQVIALDDPIGEISEMSTTKSGLQIGKMRCAIGVIGMIYEARPNVSIDAAILCLKAGNGVILRGSKDIINTNIVLVKCMQEALKKANYSPYIISLLEDTSHKTANEFMKLNGYLDVIIPRGSAKLIQNTILNATVPVLETGSGNCHIYVDNEANLNDALKIIENAKTQRTSVCNACESILLHQDLSNDFIKEVIAILKKHQVIIHGDAQIKALDEDIILATNEDYAKEYLDLEVSIKCVSSLEEAIKHINQYATHHSETIVSTNYDHIMQFMKEVDSACVYANASTRFSDGFEFGLGAEIGISTQKLHARGPMGLKALTSQKYIILGQGQIRK